MLIGAIVGGLIIFIWQFLSFAAINFHEPAQQYTEKEKTILEFLESQGLEEGGYVMPNYPPGASREEMEAKMQEGIGKPWATIQYHKAMDDNMVMNMITGFVVNIIAVFLFCWIAVRIKTPTFGTIFTSAVVLGLIIFLNAPYVNHIWFQTFDIWAFLLDYVVSWGLTGLWLGWWLTRNQSQTRNVKVSERPKEMAD